MAYVKRIWKQKPDLTTPINALSLNNIEDGISLASEEVSLLMGKEHIGRVFKQAKLNHTNGIIDPTVFTDVNEDEFLEFSVVAGSGFTGISTYTIDAPITFKGRGILLTGSYPNRGTFRVRGTITCPNLEFLMAGQVPIQVSGDIVGFDLSANQLSFQDEFKNYTQQEFNITIKDESVMGRPTAGQCTIFKVKDRRINLRLTKYNGNGAKFIAFNPAGTSSLAFDNVGGGCLLSVNGVTTGAFSSAIVPINNSNAGTVAASTDISVAGQAI